MCNAVDAYLSTFSELAAKVASFQSLLDQNAVQLAQLERKVSDSTLEIAQVMSPRLLCPRGPSFLTFPVNCIYSATSLSRTLPSPTAN
jgi:hypothetical protein